jgi:hypothetical protein
MVACSKDCCDQLALLVLSFLYFCGLYLLVPAWQPAGNPLFQIGLQTNPDSHGVVELDQFFSRSSACGAVNFESNGA